MVRMCVSDHVSGDVAVSWHLAIPAHLLSYVRHRCHVREQAGVLVDHPPRLLVPGLSALLVRDVIRSYPWAFIKID